MHRIANPINVPTTVQHGIGRAERQDNNWGLGIGRPMEITRYQRGGRFMHAPSHEEKTDLTWYSPKRVNVRSGNQNAAEVGVSSDGVEIGYGAYVGEREADAMPEPGSRDAIEAGMGMTGEDKSGPDPLIPVAKIAVPLALAALVYYLFIDKDRVR
jgi:hypothetical protein